MATIIILVIVLIFSALIVPFARQLVKDKVELKQTPINKKFELLVSIINDTLLEGRGEITLFDDDPRLMNLMSDDRRNLLIQFYYSTGNLTITLNYKYFQKELVHKEVYPNVRNITIFGQKDIANSFIEVCNKKILEHQQKVSYNDAQKVSPNSFQANSQSDPTQMLSAVYEDLSLHQKQSIINLMCMIAKYGGKDDAETQKLSAISQQILILKVSWVDCKTQFVREGESAVLKDLKSLEESSMGSIILSIMQLLHELSFPSANIDPDLLNYTLGLFEKLGYSEQRVEGMLKKIMLLGQMFGI